jgi:hypothetical protein
MELAEEEVLAHVYGDYVEVRAQLIVDPERYQRVLNRLVEKGQLLFSDARHEYQVTSQGHERLRNSGVLSVAPSSAGAHLALSRDPPQLQKGRL